MFWLPRHHVINLVYLSRIVRTFPSMHGRHRSVRVPGTVWRLYLACAWVVAWRNKVGWWRRVLLVVRACNANSHRLLIVFHEYGTSRTWYGTAQQRKQLQLYEQACLPYRTSELTQFTASGPGRLHRGKSGYTIVLVISSVQLRDLLYLLARLAHAQPKARRDRHVM
jgi:hypothetical protein